MLLYHPSHQPFGTSVFGSWLGPLAVWIGLGGGGKEATKGGGDGECGSGDGKSDGGGGLVTVSQ